MGHYDFYYEERAEAERERVRLLQERCKHSWVPYACTLQGKVTKVECRYCNLVKSTQQEG